MGVEKTVGNEGKEKENEREGEDGDLGGETAGHGVETRIENSVDS